MGLVDIEIEISKDEYEQLEKMDYRDLDNYGRDIQDKTPFKSTVYGYYGCGLFERNGKHYLRYTRSDSC